jgi:uncharacterized protein
MISASTIEKVASALTSPSPDIPALIADMSDCLTPDDSLRVVRRAASRMNADMFPPVTHLELILTEGCNLACTYCFEKEMLGYRRMSLATAKEAVDLLFDYSRDAETVRITHFGGEPTLNFEAIRFVTEYAEEQAALRHKKVEFDTTTNGTLLTESMVEYFAQHGIMALLSIDGMAQTNNLFRVDKRGFGTFDRVLSGMRLLKNSQRWVGVKMTVMPENTPRLFEDVKGLYALGANQFIIGHATGIVWPENAIEIYGEQLTLVHAWYQKNKGPDLRITDFDEVPPAKSFFGCQAGRSTIAVTVDGEISSCSKILALDNKKLLARLGDVRSGVTHLRNRDDLVSCSSLMAACHEKGIAEDFQGGCFASNYSAHQDLFSPNLQDHQFSILTRSVCSGCSSSR